MNRFFAHALRRLPHEDDGFSLMETVVALAVLFVSLLALAHTAAVGFTDIGVSRQRTQANQIANKVLEQVRGLTYERVSQGLKTSDLSGDPSITPPCADGSRYYRACPTADPSAEKIVHSLDASSVAPLMPHRTTYGTSAGYTSTFTAAVYVTQAKAVPQTGAYRVTVQVTWSPSVRPGLSSSVTTQSLLYTPEGTTDATTGSGTAPFFYGTGSIGRAPVTVTPMGGVSGGTGVTGLPAWDSVTEDLYGLETSVQEQTLARAESRAVMTGARKVVAGVETASGGDTAEAIADTDPSTTAGTTSSPSGLMQSAVSAAVSGGGNSVDVVAASGGGGMPCPPTQPGIKWMTGFEHGRGSSAMGSAESGMFSQAAASAGSSISIDSTNVRSGSYSFRAVANGGQAYGHGVSSGGASGVMHFAVRLASLPTSDVTSLFYLTEAFATGTPRAILRYNASANRFAVWMENNDVLTTPVVGTVPVVAGQWHVIDMKFDMTSTTHRLDWMVDGQSQPQATQTGTVASSFGIDRFYVGSTGTSTFTANFDDMIFSRTGSDYPIPDGAIKLLVPDGSGTHNLGGAMTNEAGGTTDSATWWQKLDEIAPGTGDYVKQTAVNTSAYAEFTFQNPVDTCIRGVQALLFSAATADGSNNGELRIRNGTAETTVHDYNLNTGTAGTVNGMGGMVPSSGTAWTQSEVAGLRARIGYSEDVGTRSKPSHPRWDALTIQYYVPASGEVTEGGAGTETGSAAATTSASAGTPCGAPTQLDGRLCSYAREDYSTAGPPHLTTKLDLTGSGAGKANLYRFWPATQGGSTSSVWGRRTPGTGGAGTVKQTVVRYPGTHALGALPSVMGAGPAGWQGYWVRYDAGTSPSTISAEAGVGAGPPTITSAGTVSYWVQACGCYQTLTPPLNGSPLPIPASMQFTHTAGGFRVEICPGSDASDICSLAISPSTCQPACGVGGTTTRTDARATLGSPIAGTFTYKVTNTSTNAVVAYVKVAVDLGTISATARYAP